jgi:hypothetical protein
LVELARQKADSEALFAFNAKKSCEEHSTIIAQLKGAVEANVNSIATNKLKADELAALITANKPVISGDIKKLMIVGRKLKKLLLILRMQQKRGQVVFKKLKQQKALLTRYSKKLKDYAMLL